ncbi:hypothetical protein P280DRAFT_411735 [Massarina eburnea CBS 473.64]|uniref:DUF6594 domain-containing protein n=1 Tax=Massarina eburnea CBS 473.64 TaxID=1395130 RepID=A0A6A6RJ69_9PLEO|nr:hypothetical protein P280DRAFT_411735 [Massarina eburnea CBS 473.64]
MSQSPTSTPLCGPATPHESPTLRPPTNPLHSHPPPSTGSSVTSLLKAPAPKAPVPSRFTMPWKYDGYQSFTAWMASEDDFFLFRRFDTLNARTILWMQDRIIQIEEFLQQKHKEAEDDIEKKGLRNDSFRFDHHCMKERQEKMKELSVLLRDYNQHIETFSKIRARPLAEPRKISNVINWLKREAIYKDEYTFINHAHELISINHRTLSPFGSWLESFVLVHVSWPFRIRKPSPPSTIPPTDQTGSDPPSDPPTTIYSSNARFDAFTNICILFSGLVMLLVPMWWLENISDSEKRLKVITGFVTVFMGMMSLGVVGRPFEVVAATAVYAAVLMVFMRIGQ